MVCIVFYALTFVEKCDSQKGSRREFILAATTTSIPNTEECFEFSKYLKENWYRYYGENYASTVPCYKWSKELESIFRRNVDCLENFSRDQVLKVFGNPTKMSKFSIRYKTSQNCLDKHSTIGNFGIIFRFNENDTTIINKVVFGDQVTIDD